MRPPKPTEYKHGDVHLPTGRIFNGYFFNNNKWNESLYQSTNVFGAQLEKMMWNAKQRAIRDQVPFDIDFNYLKSIVTQTCPAFGIQLTWGTLGEGVTDNSPSLDKIKPEWGYVKGNVCIISHIANKIKQDVGWEELMALALWLKEKTEEVKQNVRPEQLAFIPTRTRRSGKDDSQLGFVFTTGLGEDSDDAYNHCGADAGKDFDHRTQESSGDGVAHRNKKVEPLEGFTRSEDYGDTEPENDGFEYRGGRLFD